MHFELPSRSYMPPDNRGTALSEHQRPRFVAMHCIAILGFAALPPIQAQSIPSVRSRQEKRVTVSVVSTGADPTGRKDSRASIQSAIDKVSSAGGGVVEFPRGVYLLDSFKRTTHPWKFYNLLVGSHVTLHSADGATLLQGVNGRSKLPVGTGYIENAVVAFGTPNFQIITFQNLSYNGGFHVINATQAGDSNITLVHSSEASKFKIGDYVAIYSKTSGDVIESEMSRITLVNERSGELGLAFPLARSFKSPYLSLVTDLATTDIGIQNLTVQGAIPLVITEAFDFTASNCRFIYDSASAGSSLVTPLMANTIRGFRMEHSSIEPAGAYYAALELPERNSQNVVFDDVTVKVKNVGFGEYAAHWQLINSHFWLFPDLSVAIGLGLGALDLEVANNDIHVTNITAGSGSGSVVADNDGPGEYNDYIGGVRIHGNRIECRADGNSCMRLTTRDPVVTGNEIIASGNACGIKVEGPSGATISDNTIRVGSSSAVVLNSSTDATRIIGNVLSGSGQFAIFIASPAKAQLGGHVISGNRISGFKSDVFMDAALHPGTHISSK